MIEAETGLHKLGGKVVREKRKDHSSEWGCRKCYDDLRSPEVSYNFLQTKTCDSCSFLYGRRRFCCFILVRVGV